MLLEPARIWRQLLLTILLVGTGTTLGATIRYYVTLWAAQRFGTGFPFGTFLINSGGSLAFGFFVTAATQLHLSTEWLLFLGPGVFSGLTTFSTFSYETMSLVTEGSYREAAINLLGSLFLGISFSAVGVVLGLALVR
jgi:fluoride exporter